LRTPIEELYWLLSQSQEDDEYKHDHVVSCPEMSFDLDCNLNLRRDGAEIVPPVEMTDHALRQLYQKLGPGHFGAGSNKSLPFDYLQAHTHALRAGLLNTHLNSQLLAERRWLVRCFCESCRAVLHERYPIIPNSDLLLATIDAIGDNVPPQMRLVRPYLTENKLVLRIMWSVTDRPDNRGGYYALGTFIANDEIGAGRSKVWPLIQQTGCTNSIVLRPLRDVRQQALFNVADMNAYDEEADQQGNFVGVSLVHRGERDKLLFVLKETIGQSLGASAEFINKMIAAETQRLPDFSSILTGLAKKYGWNEEQRTQITLGARGEATVAGLISGVTFAAQSCATQDEQIAMEVIAGDMLIDTTELFSMVRRKMTLQDI